MYVCNMQSEGIPVIASNLLCFPSNIDEVRLWDLNNAIFSTNSHAVDSLTQNLSQIKDLWLH